MEPEQKPKDEEILFRAKLSFGGEVLLRRRILKFIVERTGLTGKYAAQNDSFDDVNDAYPFYKSILDAYEGYVTEQY